MYCIAQKMSADNVSINIKDPSLHLSPATAAYRDIHYYPTGSLREIAGSIRKDYAKFDDKSNIIKHSQSHMGPNR